MIHGVLYAVYILFFLFVKLSLSCGRVVDQHVRKILFEYLLSASIGNSITCGDEKLLNFVKLDNKEPCMALNKEAPKTPATPKISLRNGNYEILEI